MSTADSRGLTDRLRGGLIVSCQAYPGEPMRHPETMAQVARSAELGGAAGIRCQGLADISAITGQVQVPVIGIWKDGDHGVVITPTLRHARACLSAGADIIALDATGRRRPDGLSFGETARALHDEGAVLMADCGSQADADRAAEAGAVILSTTLAGYSGERSKTEGPDLELLARMVSDHPELPVIAEGRIHSPEQAGEALDLGAWAVVVGTAITHPMSLTRSFRAGME